MLGAIAKFSGFVHLGIFWQFSHSSARISNLHLNSNIIAPADFLSVFSMASGVQILEELEALRSWKRRYVIQEAQAQQEHFKKTQGVPPQKRKEMLRGLSSHLVTP